MATQSRVEGRLPAVRCWHPAGHRAFLGKPLAPCQEAAQLPHPGLAPGLAGPQPSCLQAGLPGDSARCPSFPSLRDDVDRRDGSLPSGGTMLPGSRGLWARLGPGSGPGVSRTKSIVAAQPTFAQ